MSFNGSGTFVINSAGQPVVSGTVISSTAFNALTADLANGLSTCITKDGQTTPTADIPMGSNKITGLANGTAAGDAANLGQVQSTVAKLLGSVSGADTITAVGSPTVAAYAAGQMFYFVAAGANTGAVTINIDSLGAKNITRDGTTALAAGDIQSGEVCVIVYDGTQFQLVNGASQSAAIVTNSLTVNGTSSLDGAVTINDSGADVDFRVEGDTDANLLFADASTDRVGVGTDTPASKLHVLSASSESVRIAYDATKTARLGVTSSGDLQVYAFDGSNYKNILLAVDATTSAGNVGIGTSSPGAKLDVVGSLGIRVNEDGSGTKVISIRSDFAGAGPAVNVPTNHPLLLQTNNTERARITAGGDLLVGTTSTTPNPGVAIFPSGGIGQGNSAGASGFEFHSFRRSAVQIGSITQNGTTAVAYNTSSDRRLKENIVPAPDAGAKIDAIEIVSHDWKSTPDEHVEFGVVAQDLALIAPQAVTAGDDGEEIEKAWGVDYSKLVPMLIKEVQSLRKRVAELEAK